MADKRTTKVTKEVVVTEAKEPPKEPEPSDIDTRMENLLKEHQEMGARPK